MKIITAFRMTAKALLKRDEESRFFLAERITGLLCPRYKFSDLWRPYLYDEKFLRYYESFDRQNYHSLDRKYALDQLVKSIRHVDGDTAECGAYRGASSYLICRRIQGSGKQHYVFDSFEGLSAPSEVDGSYWKPGDFSAEEHEIRHNLREFDFVHYCRGWIPERFGEVSDRRFCFVHLDIDLHRPTLDSLEFFYPRMNPGGIILCDDYTLECPGAQQAMDEYFQERPEEVVILPTGQAFVTKR